MGVGEREVCVWGGGGGGGGGRKFTCVAVSRHSSRNTVPSHKMQVDGKVILCKNVVHENT